MTRIVVVAGEASGDQLGAGLIRSLHAVDPAIEIEGIAGPAMAAAGCHVWRDSEELAVMGLFEIVRHLPRLRRIMRDTEARVLTNPPDLFIGIDAPEFNLRIEGRARKAGIRTVHYVSPSVWAWRQRRVRVLQRACDLVLCLLPFEADFLRAHGVDARFVGHPLADEIPAPLDRSDVRRELGIDADTVVAVLPGSRLSEVERLTPLFARAAQRIAAHGPDTLFLIPAASPEVRRRIDALWQHSCSGIATRVLDGEARAAMGAADAVLLASGTATLEAMLVGRPMVVAYRLARLTAAVGRLFRLLKIQHFALPNLLAGEGIVPELMQEAATPEALAGAMIEIFDNPDSYTELLEQFQRLAGGIRRSASDEAAKAALELLGQDTTAA